VDVAMPPIMGAAIRFITSAPLPSTWAHMIGTSPSMVDRTVIIFGLTRSTAPSNTAS